MGRRLAWVQWGGGMCFGEAAQPTTTPCECVILQPAKSAEVTWPAQPTPQSPEARGTTALEISRSEGPPGLHVSSDDAIPTAVPGPVFNLPAPEGPKLEYKVKGLSYSPCIPQTKTQVDPQLSA